MLWKNIYQTVYREVSAEQINRSKLMANLCIIITMRTFCTLFDFKRITKLYWRSTKIFELF